MSYKKLRGAYEEARINRFTAASDVEDGDVIVENGRVGVAHNDTASGEEGLALFGTDEKGIMMPKATGAIGRNAKLYWDEDGNPVGGAAGSGAITTVATGNILVGRAAEPAASGDAEAQVELTNQ